MSSKEGLKIISWNINGLRAVVRNGFTDFLQQAKPDILGVQEIKIADRDRVKAEFDFSGFEEYWCPAKRSGYSGTGILTKVKPLAYWTGLKIPEFDDEGRVQTMEFSNFYLVNAYFPNANAELSRLDYKLRFNQAMLAYLKELDQKKPVLIMGDFNVAHEEIDIARPKDNEGHSGFTPEERRDFSGFLTAKFVDTFRAAHPETVRYSWWSYRTFARDRGIGWRIDYCLASQRLQTKITDAFILDEVLGSDHAPIGIKITL